MIVRNWPKCWNFRFRLIHSLWRLLTEINGSLVGDQQLAVWTTQTDRIVKSSWRCGILNRFELDWCSATACCWCHSIWSDAFPWLRWMSLKLFLMQIAKSWLAFRRFSEPTWKMISCSAWLAVYIYTESPSLPSVCFTEPRSCRLALKSWWFRLRCYPDVDFIRWLSMLSREWHLLSSDIGHDETVLENILSRK